MSLPAGVTDELELNYVACEACIDGLGACIDGLGAL